MSEAKDPGKRGRPAPWTRKKQEERRLAENQRRRVKYPEYARWQDERASIWRAAHDRAKADDPSSAAIGAAMDRGNEAAQRWTGKNPSPLSFEQHHDIS